MKAMNLEADAMTLATARVVDSLKSKWCDDGRKLRDFSTGDHRKAIAALLANDPTIVERAAEDIERWILAGVFGKRRRSQLTTFVQKPRR